MFDIIKLVFDICLFKKGPQDLPDSVWLLRILLVAYVSIRALMLSIHFDWLTVLLQIVVEIFLVFGFVWIISMSPSIRHAFVCIVEIIAH